MKSNAFVQEKVEVRDPRSFTDLGEFMGSFLGSAQHLIQAERSHLTFMVTKRTAEAVRKVTGSLGAIVFFGMAVLFASVACAIWIGRELESDILGFLIVAGAYVVAGIVFGSLWKGAAGKRFMTGLINSFHGH